MKCRAALGRLSLSAALITPLLALPSIAHAEIRLPHVLSDHAVLQRDAPIHIWGWSEPGEAITARFHAQTVTATANKYGEWSLWLMPEKAGGPFTLTLDGNMESSSGPVPAPPGSDSTATTAASTSGTTAAVTQPGPPAPAVTISDLLVGDVWFASGQSNMQMPLGGFPGSAVLKNADQEIAAATQPQMRLLHVDQAASDVPLVDIKSTWTLCTPETAVRFSAVAYFFGRDLSNREHVPIGLIDSTWGGTPVESWISLDGIAADASLMPMLAFRARFADQQSRLHAVIAEERREDAAAKAAGQTPPKHPWHPAENSWAPAYLFNAMVAPETPYTIKGVIWYQGETNSNPERASQYVRLFPALISDWREQWKQGNFPFLFVQISSFDSPEEDWGTIRDAQRRTLSLVNTAMAVTLDIGSVNNVHPPDKQTVGARLALAARNMVYGEQVEFSGPLFRQATVDNHGFHVWFDHAAGLTSKGGALHGFEVAGQDKKYVTATATIEGSNVAVSSPVKDPVYVRYGWAGFGDANLYNGAGLPASTFTSEPLY